MIAFWVCNNNQLINSVNLKLHYYKDMPADLYVRTNIISEELISIINNNAIFENIIFLEYPLLSAKKVKFGSHLIFRVLFSYKLRTHYYQNYLNQLTNTKNYDHLFVAGFWADSIYLIDYFSKINTKLQVSFFDEGTSSLYFTKRKFLWYFPAANWRNKCYAIYTEFLLRLKHSKRFDGKLYLYPQDIYKADNKIIVMRLPKITDDNFLCKKIILNGFDMEDSSILDYRYSHCKVCYLATPPTPSYEENYSRTYQILDEISECCSTKELIIKPHPTNTDHRKKFAQQYEVSAYVDRQLYFFERLFLTVDFNNKVLISRNSSSLFYAKAVYGQEPYIIFTFRLYPYYHQFGEDSTEEYAQDIKAMYDHPEKIFIPNTIMELRMILRRLLRNEN